MKLSLILFGAPGSGKGTQAKLLKEKLSIPHISTGDILRGEIASSSQLGKRVEGILASGQLVDDTLMTELIEKRFSEDDVRKGFILDGYPRNIRQAEILGKILSKQKISQPQVFYLKIERNDLISRLVGRLSCSNCGRVFHESLNAPKKIGYCDYCDGLLKKRSDDTEETVASRIDIFLAETMPVLDYYKKLKLVNEIDGSASIAKIFEVIMSKLTVVQ